MGLMLFYKQFCTDTDPNTGKNRGSPIFRYSSEFRYSSRSWKTHHLILNPTRTMKRRGGQLEQREEGGQLERREEGGQLEEM